MSRYSKHKTVYNSEPIFKQLLDERQIKTIKHYRLRTNTSLSQEFLDSLDYIEIIWDYTSKLSKISNRFYGDPNLWWIIGLVNKKPTDFHWSIGDIVKIPRDPSLVQREADTF